MASTSPAEGELDRRFDGVAGDAAGTQQSLTIRVRVAAAQPPRPDRDSPRRGYSGDLVFRADDRDLGIEWLGQRAGRDLGPNPARVPQRDGEPRT